MRRIRWTRGRILLAALAALAIAVALDYALYPRLATVRAGKSWHVPPAAIWLRYWWFTGDRSIEELEAELERLSELGIGDHYFCVGQIGPDGRLERGHPDSAREIGALWERQWGSPEPEWRIDPIAWIIVLNERAGGEVDIADPAVRANMVEEAVWLVEEAGFRGVQWDWEFAPGATDDLIALLRESRETLPFGTTISVTTPPWLPWPLGRWGWSEDDFRRIGAECDEICVMCYDTGMVLPRACVWLVRQQVIRVALALSEAEGHCRFRVGVPTYGDEGSLASHHAHAENLRMALKGLREGEEILWAHWWWPHPRSQAARMAGRPAWFGHFQGPAIFANWTTDEADWRTWEELWADAEQ